MAPAGADDSRQPPSSCVRSVLCPQRLWLSVCQGWVLAGCVVLCWPQRRTGTRQQRAWVLAWVFGGRGVCYAGLLQRPSDLRLAVVCVGVDVGPLMCTVVLTCMGAAGLLAPSQQATACPSR